MGHRGDKNWISAAFVFSVNVASVCAADDSKIPLNLSSFSIKLRFFVCLFVFCCSLRFISRDEQLELVIVETSNILTKKSL